MIKSIALVGGTHGNEMSGIQLIQNWENQGTPSRFDLLDITLYTANPAAIAANTRFLEEDLNRQFTHAALEEATSSQENELAKTINQQLGPKGASATDLVIDIHNTTSHMGATLIILDTSDFYVQMARYVKQHMPESNILVEDEKAYLEHGYLCTTGKYGVMIEVGAQPQGVLREDVFLSTQKMAEVLLDFCIAFNNEECGDLPPCEAFRLGENISFPLDEDGNRTAMIHHALQDSDFVPLVTGAPMFRTFEGKDIVWQADETTYPHFINEAAYNKLHVAFATSTLITL
ncbi:aspartoacylase [Alteromonas sp.]|nr:aspartoacylase [Alteromonas sp.]